ncbi:DNA-binding transcriptional regulator, AcrR family [Sinosporangium album]|uniref:DNA-binding transcriptional regulator, AcrR family n=1 Tax=Sinosporangium album TaxID=504805 RepID=A0A1G7SJM7_9ACTN|nr:TetR/AcrR family transcriptional regulator [Sinosporangium album]SDG23267.1 DNA-binding transcriptional regulator, AcrR family [Sinosporangium album]
MTIPAEQRRIAADEVRLPPGLLPDGRSGRILVEALRLFAEYGFHDTSIRDLAKASGIRSATLYTHYPSKEHVLAELIRLGHEAHHTALAAALPGTAPGSAERLAALVRAHVLGCARYPLLASIANSELHALSPGLAAPSLLLRADSRQMMLDTINLGLDAGVFDVPDPFLALTAIAGMGIRVANWYGSATPYTPEDIADSYAAFALRLAGARA